MSSVLPSKVWQSKGLPDKLSCWESMAKGSAGWKTFAHPSQNSLDVHSLLEQRGSDDDVPFPKVGYVGSLEGILKQWEDSDSYRSGDSSARCGCFLPPKVVNKHAIWVQKKGWNTPSYSPDFSHMERNKHEGSFKRDPHLPGKKIFRFLGLVFWVFEKRWSSGFLFSAGFEEWKSRMLGNVTVLNVRWWAWMFCKSFGHFSPRNEEQLSNCLGGRALARRWFLLDMDGYFPGYGWSTSQLVC